MRIIEAKEAKTRFSVIVDAAEHGEPTTIVKNGKPSALVTPVPAAERFQITEKPNFGAFLLSFPTDIESEPQCRDPCDPEL